MSSIVCGSDLYLNEPNGYVFRVGHIVFLFFHFVEVPLKGFVETKLDGSFRLFLILDTNLTGSPKAGFDLVVAGDFDAQMRTSKSEVAIKLD